MQMQFKAGAQPAKQMQFQTTLTEADAIHESCAHIAVHRSEDSKP